MKQALIVLTLWILSQNAYGQSTRLEEYSRSEALFVSTEHPNSLINRQPMADVPHSFLAKSETPAPAPLQKTRAAAGQDKTSQDEVKALWANTKALEENTRALDENTKALKENTEMMRRLLESGQYKNTNMLAAQEANQLRLQSAVALSDKPTPHFPIFSNLPLEEVVPVQAAAPIAKPEPLMASASLRTMPAKAVPVREPAKKIAPSSSVARPTVTKSIAVVKSEMPEVSAKSDAMNRSKSQAATAMASKITAKPNICFLNSSSNSPENAPMTSYAAKASAAPRAWAANGTVKTQAKRVVSSASSLPTPVANAVAKKPAPNKVLAPAPPKVVSSPKELAANTPVRSNNVSATLAGTKKNAVSEMAKTNRPVSSMPVTIITAPKAVAAKSNLKPQAPKAITPAAGPKIPLASVMTKAPSHANLPANPIPGIAVAKPQAPKAITPVAGPKMSVASIMAAPHHAGIPATATEHPRSAASAAPKAQPMPVTTIVASRITPNSVTKTPEHSNLPANPIPAKMAGNAKMNARNATLKPQVSAVLIPVAAIKPTVSFMRTNESPAKVAPKLTAPKPRAAAAGHAKTNTAASSMSVVIETGMLAKKNKRVSLGYILQFPLLERSYDNQLRAAGHMPTDTYSGFKEGDMVTTHGYISMISIEDSGKQNETYYIQLVANPYKKDSCLNIRITSDRFAGEARKRLTENAREFVRQQLLSGKNPSQGGSVMQNPVFVSITGQLVYNSALAGAMRGPHPLYIGKKGVRSYTPWEISNVNRLQFTR